MVSFPIDESLYVGDVLLAVNGISATSFPTPDDLIEAMRRVKNKDIMITILPLSPLRYPD